MRLAYDRRRRIVLAALARSRTLRAPAPEGAFYAFIDVRGTGMPSAEFSRSLLAEQHVAVVPGEAFGAAGSGFVRVSYAGDPDDIREGMRRLVAFADGQRVRA
jgi:aminotransferase